MMWNLVFTSIAFSFVVPLVSFNVDESTATAQVGSRGGKGRFFTTAFYANFARHPTGGYVTCDFPTGGALLHTKNEFCDVVQYGLPITAGVLGLALMVSARWNHVAIYTVKWLLAAAVLALVLSSLVIVTDKDTYQNVGEATPTLDFGGGTLIVAILSLVAAMAKPMFSDKDSGPSLENLLG